MLWNQAISFWNQYDRKRGCRFAHRLFEATTPPLVYCKPGSNSYPGQSLEPRPGTVLRRASLLHLSVQTQINDKLSSWKETPNIVVGVWSWLPTMVLVAAGAWTSFFPAADGAGLSTGQVLSAIVRRSSVVAAAAAGRGSAPLLHRSLWVPLQHRRHQEDGAGSG